MPILLPDLPACMKIADGEIRVNGSRIGLVDIVEQYNSGLSAESLAERFPTVSLGQILHVLAYYVDHRSQVDAFVNAVLNQSALNRAAHTPSERMLKIRERVRQIHNERIKGAHAS